MMIAMAASDRRIEEHARRQHGVFTRQQAVAAGASRHEITHRVTSRAWIRLESGVYALASHRPSWQRQYVAAVLGASDGAIGGLASARVHELERFRVVRPEIVVPPGSNSRSRLATVHRQAGVAVTRVDAIPVTTIAQTLADIAGRVPVRRVERAMDEAILAGRLTLSDLEERARFYEGSRRRGLPVFRALVAERAALGWVPQESELEARLDELLVRLPSRPRVIRQASLPWRPSLPLRTDRLLPDWRTLVEADGRRWHARVTDFDRDRWRDNEAQAHGYRLLRFTWVHLTVAADEVLALLEQVGRCAMAA